MATYGIRDFRLYFYSGHEWFDADKVWEQVSTIAKEHNTLAYHPDHVGDRFHGPYDETNIWISCRNVERFGEMVEKFWQMKELATMEIEHEGR